MMGNAMSVFLMFGIVLTLVGTVGTGFVIYQRRLQWQEIRERSRLTVSTKVL